MAQLIQVFDANKFDPTQSAGMLPIGKHLVIVDSSEVKPNKENNGGYLQLNLKIIDGPQAGASGAYRLNLYHSNQQTVEIAHKQLSAICHVTGVFMLQDSAQLHNIPFIVEVGPQKNDAQYTEVKKVFDTNGNEPGKAGQGHAPAQPAAAQAPAGFGQQPQAQQPQAQQPQQAAAPAWGAAPQGQLQPPQQQAAAAPAWGQPAQQQQPQQPAAAQAPAAWNQGQAPAATPPWGQR